MLQAITTATSGLMTAAKQLNETAEAVARAGTTAPASVDQTAGPQTVRVGYLPLPGGANLAEAAVSMAEAEASFKANVAVIKTADDMLYALLDAVSSDDDNR